MLAYCPVRLLGIHVSYDKKGNNELNFNLKIRKLQTNLDMWRSRDLTLFGKVLIIKSWGLSQLIYSASILNVPEEVARTVKTKLFSFLWKNKRDKIKRTGLSTEVLSSRIRQEPSITGIKIFGHEIKLSNLRTTRTFSVQI